MTRSDVIDVYTEDQQKGLAQFCANRYWKAIFDGAPSQEVQKYYAEIFAFSSGLSEAKAHTDTIRAIFKTLSDEDWDYIIENCLNNMGRWGLQQNREKYGHQSGFHFFEVGVRWEP